MYPQDTPPHDKDLTIDERIAQENSTLSTYTAPPPTTKQKIIELLKAHKLMVGSSFASVTLLFIAVGFIGHRTHTLSGETIPSDPKVASSIDGSATPQGAYRLQTTSGESIPLDDGSDDDSTDSGDDNSIELDSGSDATAATNNSGSAASSSDESSSDDYEIDTSVEPIDDPVTQVPQAEKPTPAQPGNPNPSSAGKAGATINFASYNVHLSTADQSTVNDINRLNSSAGADIIGLQEVQTASKGRAIRKGNISCAGCVYAGYVPNDSRRESSILWRRSKFTLLGSNTIRVAPHTRVDDGHIARELNLNYVKLKINATGRTIYVLNNHLMVNGTSPSHPIAQRLYRLQVAALRNKVSELRSTGLPVFVLGDFNTNYRTDSRDRDHDKPYYNMAQVDTYANWQYLGTPSEGTMKNRSNSLIDYVYARKHSAVTLQAQHLYSNYASDHKALVVQATVR